MRGVDSISNLTEEEIIEIGKDVSIEFKAVVVITGPTNYIIEGEDKVVKVEGGNKLMGSITGSGCALGVQLQHLCPARPGHRKVQITLCCCPCCKAL